MMIRDNNIHAPIFSFFYLVVVGNSAINSYNQPDFLFDEFIYDF